DLRALAVPELPDARPVCPCVADERAARGDFRIGRVIVEQARLEIDNDAYVLPVELVERGMRLRKLVAIPREYVTALADARVTGSEMKRRQRDVVSNDLIGELRQP